MDTKDFGTAGTVVLQQRQTKRIAPVGAMATAMVVDQPSVSQPTAPPQGLAAHNVGPGQAELFALFECPVCFDYALPPISQCQVR